MEKPVLVTGATGYVGGRLVPELLEVGYRVRAVSRTRAKLESRPWADHPAVELTEVNALDQESMKVACRGCEAAYYLIHSMNPGTMDFEEADRQAASNMARAAEAEGVERIIYLGGLGEEDERLSKHLRSRAEVARILRESTVATTVLRAAIIIGSGSVSFEILRYLVERLPVMTTPRWVQTESQPIAIRNVLAYLVGCLDHPETAGETYDIGGPDVVTYSELMQTYAKTAGLPRRWIIPLPVLTPKLSSLWVHLVTPVPATIARPLIDGLRNPAVCKDDRIREVIPQDLIDVETAMELALDVVESEEVPSSWSDAGKIPPAEWADESDPEWAGGDLFEDHRTLLFDGKPEELWSVVERIGGENGWYYADWLWSIRGFLDRLFGGVGLRRGRRDAEDLQVGDALDFWRVKDVSPPNRLLLVAEMLLPGEATLEFRIEETPEGTRCDQIARFRPQGLLGLLYWYVISPFHNYIFNGMLRNIARQADGSIKEGPGTVS